MMRVDVTIGLLCAQFALNLVIAIVGWVSLRAKATAAEIEDLRLGIESQRRDMAQNCAKHQTRTTTLEERVRNAPSQSDIRALHDRISGVKGSVDELSGMLKGISGNLRLLVEHHLRGDDT